MAEPSLLPRPGILFPGHSIQRKDFLLCVFQTVGVLQVNFRRLCSMEASHKEVSLDRAYFQLSSKAILAAGS